jgi:hypothetical protein
MYLKLEILLNVIIVLDFFISHILEIPGSDSTEAENIYKLYLIYCCKKYNVLFMCVVPTSYMSLTSLG